MPVNGNLSPTSSCGKDRAFTAAGTFTRAARISILVCQVEAGKASKNSPLPRNGNSTAAAAEIDTCHIGCISVARGRAFLPCTGFLHKFNSIGHDRVRFLK